MNNAYELVARHHPRPQRCQMFCVHLAIDQLPSICKKLLSESEKRCFGCIRFFGVHRFSEKTVAEFDAVKSAEEFIVFPRFTAESVTGFVKFNVRLFHFICNPRSALTSTFDPRAFADDGFERSIEPDFEFTRVENFPHAFGDDEILRKDYKAWIGAPPHNGLAFAVPGEDAGAVSGE